MFDDFGDPSEPAFEDERQAEVPTGGRKARQSRRKRSRQPFLGMPAFQRFVIAFMLLIITFLLSAFCLLVSGKIMPPI